MPRARTASPTLPPPTDRAVEQGPTTPPPPPPPPQATDALLAALAQRLESLEAAVLRAPPVDAHRADTGSPTPTPAAARSASPHPSPRDPQLYRADSTAPAVAAPATPDHYSDAESGSDVEEIAAPRHSSVQDLLRGEDRHLPCPHVYHNPYPRAPQLHHRACHYSPSKAGDATHGEVHRGVHKTHEKLLVEVCKEELCTLVPVLSALFDLQEYVADVCAEVQGARQLPGAAVRESLHTIAAQLNAARTLANERLDAIEAATHSRSEWAAHARALYGQERALTGARAPLGDHLAASVQSRAISAHHGAIARATEKMKRGWAFRRVVRIPRRCAPAHGHASVVDAVAALGDAFVRARDALAHAESCTHFFQLPGERPPRSSDMSAWLAGALEELGVSAPPGFAYLGHSLRSGASSAAEAIHVSRYKGNWLGGWSQTGRTRELHYIDPSFQPTPAAYAFFGWLLEGRYQALQPEWQPRRGAVDSDEPGEP
ncbi:hypothetical protein AB1Y20_006582 [Prymnesium parvum]|uniref:Uncharacterized protein n=1 Tax=Prymnesium parvum TaxID=97485 RepID=A0AB34IXU2_PRYPA